jgi:uncharacterized membrane protein YoaK (UPF0700 family)
MIRAAMKNHRIAALLGFVAGFVDTAGFLGLQGLFTAHVTGNFVTLGATLVLGTHGVYWRFRNSSWWSPSRDWRARPWRRGDGPRCGSC